MTTCLKISLIILSISLTKLFCIVAHNTRLMDKPNERSLHVVPTIRGGGLVFIALFLVFLLSQAYFVASFSADRWLLFASVLLLASINFLDDVYTLSAKIRFLIQFLIAGAVLAFVVPESLNFLLFSFDNPYLIAPFVFFTVIWAINHFNFMDGIDGFCALQAVFLFVAYAFLFAEQGDFLYQNLCFVLIAGLLGFLVFNFPPARLFMGDVGSATLGFISFYMALVAQQRYQIPIAYWFVLNSLFLFDATITLVRRVLNRESFFAAHRKHGYQRLKQSGMPTRSILLGQLLLNMLFLAMLLLFKNNAIGYFVLLIVPFIILLFVYFWIERLFPMFQN